MCKIFLSGVTFKICGAINKEIRPPVAFTSAAIAPLTNRNVVCNISRSCKIVFFWKEVAWELSPDLSYNRLQLFAKGYIIIKILNYLRNHRKAKKQSYKGRYRLDNSQLWTEMPHTCGVVFVYKRKEIAMDYISIAEAAEKWGITRRRVQVLCAQNRIPGLTRFGKSWAIPKDAEKPADGRKNMKSGVERD